MFNLIKIFTKEAAKVSGGVFGLFVGTIGALSAIGAISKQVKETENKTKSEESF